MKYLYDWNSEINPARADLVFEGRNKEYGGYVLRKEYDRRITLAFIFSVVVIVLLFVSPLIVGFFTSLKPVEKSNVTSTEVVLADVPPIDKVAPPPPAEPPPPVQKTIKFTPPVVVEDEKVEEPPPTQEETKEIQVSTVTQEGEDLIELPPDPVVDPDEGKIFTVVEEMPSFPGGEEALIKYIQSQIKYPLIARENSIQGKVYISFYVDKDGKVKDPKVLRGIGGGCDEEALRVVKTMPDWKPGRQNGRAVSVYYNVPISFSLK